jgi:diguanylate cyclase (GGDEF)-like protein/PAS domain S-box-containing protein
VEKRRQNPPQPRLVRWQLLVAFLITILVASTYGAGLVYQQLKAAQVEAFDGRAEFIASTLSQAAGHHISSFDWALLESLARQIERVPGIAGLQIEDHLSQKRFGDLTTVDMRGKKRYRKSIRLQTEEVGHIELVIDRSELDRSLIWLRRFLWVAVAALMLIVAAIALTYQLIQTRAHARMFAREVEQRRDADHAVRKLSVAVEQSPAAVVITDIDARIEYVNPKFLDVTGYSKAEVLGEHTRILNAGVMPKKVYRSLWDNLLAGKTWRGEFLNRKKNGETFWEYASISPIRNAEGEITNFLAVKEDITLRKAYEAQLVEQANHDSLTGLANRVLARDRLDHALMCAQRDETIVGVLFIDLDRFKKVNDTLGHAAGDELLIETAKRLQACMRDYDTVARVGSREEFGTVARLGGDEFTVILEGLTRSMDAELVADRILKACAAPYTVVGQEIYLSASIGISLYPDDAEELDLLMRNADAAMYQAKEQGRGAFRFYRREINEIAQERLELENELRRGFARGELELYFQPLYATVGSRLEGAEALLRWHNPTRGMVPPDKFIPLAEDIGLIGEIGSWVLESACEQAMRWNREATAPLYVSVNVSVRQFLQSDLAEVVARTLAESSLPPEYLKLEITESVMMQETERNHSIIESITAMGVRFVIDDFGTGYSSLSYLRNFPFESLKIDRSFVNNVTSSDNDANLVRSIVAMAISLNLKVVAEGIETEEQKAFVRCCGCDTLQGYLLGLPMPADQFLSQLTEKPAMTG